MTFLYIILKNNTQDDTNQNCIPQKENDKTKTVYYTSNICSLNYPKMYTAYSKLYTKAKNRKAKKAFQQRKI